MRKDRESNWYQDLCQFGIERLQLPLILTGLQWDFCFHLVVKSPPDMAHIAMSSQSSYDLRALTEAPTTHIH